MELKDEVHTNDMVLFWSVPSVFCQWTASSFVIDGVRYNTAEQWMMANKARLFGDIVSLAAIMGTNDPRRQKALGRKVRGYSNIAWRAHRVHVVIKGNMAKFAQNEEMKEQLLATGNRTLVEASPYDRIWGIGLSQSDPRALDVRQWQGDNLLGQALMAVRDHFQNVSS